MPLAVPNLQKMIKKHFKFSNRLFHVLLFLVAGILLLFPSALGVSVLEITQDTTSIFKKYPQGYFAEPTDSSLKIAGNFGEIRQNHFHAGLDIKTGGKEGTSILAAVDGYVSRIKISPFGYGKVIYLTHPNGYVTVYAHLQRFYGKITRYVESEQYRNESFEIELFPDSDLLRVKRCDTIAISGNTGSSQSPHLHFEVRDAKTEHALNPFLFGYKTEDTVPPKITTLAIYPLNDSSYVEGKNIPLKRKVYGSKGKYFIPSGKEKKYAFIANGEIGFGIETNDYSNILQHGKLGVYSIDLYIDGKRIYFSEMNEISFEETRYVNSYIDYAESMKSKKEIQKCFLEKNNYLSVYQFLRNEGTVQFNDTTLHQIKFIVKDFFQNTSMAEFFIKSVVTPHPIQTLKKKEGIKFKHDEENIFQTQDVRVIIPPCALYSDIRFEYFISKDTLPKTFSPVHYIHHWDVPLHTSYSISIKAVHIPNKFFSKATIVMLDEKNNMIDQSGTPSDSNGTWITATTKYFGKFAVAIDTTAPVIKPYNIYNGKNMKGTKTISVIVKDNLTGIKTHRATIDGKWILMEYEPKKNLLFYEFGQRVSIGKHEFRLEVTDEKDNTSTYRAEFVR